MALNPEAGKPPYTTIRASMFGCGGYAETVVSAKMKSRGSQVEVKVRSPAGCRYGYPAFYRSLLNNEVVYLNWGTPI